MSFPKKKSAKNSNLTMHFTIYTFTLKNVFFEKKIWRTNFFSVSAAPFNPFARSPKHLPLEGLEVEFHGD